MKLLSMMIPESLVPYIEIQKSWVEQKQTGAVEINFFQGGVTNMNLKSSVKLTFLTTVKSGG